MAHRPRITNLARTLTRNDAYGNEPINPGVPSVGEGLPNDVLKVGVHGGMNAQAEAKEKSRSVFLPPARPLTESAAWPRA